ncbi:MAG TPA: hypothetical protein VMH86_00470 [Rhizomicrobium sp.]|nr:hypothetical protein [Rhizomicrobium sp.]
MLISSLILLAAAGSLPEPHGTEVKTFIPTSVALDIAEAVARDEGYHVPNEKLFFFDLTTAKTGNPLFPGYVTISFFGSGQAINQISINERTGQVVDAMMCVVFEYPDIQKFGKDVRRTSGSRPATMDEIENEIGCDVLKVVGKR